MDLVIETKQYRFNVNRNSDITCISVFIANKTQHAPTSNSRFYLTKSEMKELSGYVANSEYDVDGWLVQELTNIEMLMSGKEKAEFYFW